MKLLLAIAAGGALGAVARYGVSWLLHAWLGRGFPWGTLGVNVLGSFLMGWLSFWLLAREAAPEWRGLVLIGALGAFTTFSTFSVENLHLLEQGHFARAGLNMLASVLLCLGAAWAGLWLGRYIH